MSIICVKWISEGIVRRSYPRFHPPPRGTLRDSAPCRGTRCALLWRAAERGPFVRHQISLFPKPGRIGCHQRVYTGAKPKPCALARVSVYTSVVPGFLQPEQTEDGWRLVGEGSLKQPVCLSTCLPLWEGLGSTKWKFCPRDTQFCPICIQIWQFCYHPHLNHIIPIQQQHCISGYKHSIVHTPFTVWHTVVFVLCSHSCCYTVWNFLHLYTHILCIYCRMWTVYFALILIYLSKFNSGQLVLIHYIIHFFHSAFYWFMLAMFALVAFCTSG